MNKEWRRGERIWWMVGLVVMSWLISLVAELFL